MRIPWLPLALLCLSALACRAPDRPATAAPEAERDVARVLDDFHDAASHADGPRYYAHLAEDAIFLGTDARERWTKAEFRAFCEPHFAKNSGWTYRARERHVFVDGDVAWFDERLWNEKYGECRGTGALRRDAGAWRIVQYNLAFPVPNELAEEFLELVR